MMQRYILSAVFVLLLMTTGHAQKEKQFYTGITGGPVIPGNLQEHWVNSRMSQTADLTHLMNTGFLAGVKAGFDLLQPLSFINKISWGNSGLRKHLPFLTNSDPDITILLIHYPL